MTTYPPRCTRTATPQAGAKGTTKGGGTKEKEHKTNNKLLQAKRVHSCSLKRLAEQLFSPQEFQGGREDLRRGAHGGLSSLGPRHQLRRVYKWPGLAVPGFLVARGLEAGFSGSRWQRSKVKEVIPDSGPESGRAWNFG